MHCRLDAQHAGSADGGIPSIGTTTSPSPGGALLHLKVEWHQRCSTRRRTPDRSACRTSVGECGAPSMPEPDELTNSEEVAVKKIESAVETGSPRRINKPRRLRQRLRNPAWRRYGYLLLGGKALGIAMLLGVVVLLMDVFGSAAHADDVVLKGNDIINPINTVWTLVAAFLVFGMQAGFTMLEAGFSRSRETVNVLMECVVDTCLCGLLFYAWGFAFMFGSGTPFFGTEFFFLQNVPATYGSSGVAFLAFWLFQYAFADTCSTITSGAMIGRTGFVGDL